MGIFHAFYIVQMLVILCKVSCNFTKIVQNFTISPKKLFSNCLTFGEIRPNYLFLKLFTKKRFIELVLLFMR